MQVIMKIKQGKWYLVPEHLQCERLLSTTCGPARGRTAMLRYMCNKVFTFKRSCLQWCGSMTFWCGVIDLQDASKKLIFNIIFSAYYFLKVHLHRFSKIKSQKESQKSRNQGFSYNFCMIIKGSGSRAGSGSIPLTSGSGSATLLVCILEYRRLFSKEN